MPLERSIDRALSRLSSLPILHICDLEGVHNLPTDFFGTFRYLKELSLRCANDNPERMRRTSMSRLG